LEDAGRETPLIDPHTTVCRRTLSAVRYRVFLAAWANKHFAINMLLRHVSCQLRWVAIYTLKGIAKNHPGRCPGLVSSAPLARQSRKMEQEMTGCGNYFLSPFL